MMRMTRAAILNVMSSPYVETAELKGLDTLRIIARHAAPNALAPIINVVALNLAYLVVGVVVVEVVFVYPGMGRSEEHTSELQSLMRISYAVFCLKKKKKNNN